MKESMGWIVQAEVNAGKNVEGQFVLSVRRFAGSNPAHPISQCEYSSGVARPSAGRIIRRTVVRIHLLADPSSNELVRVLPETSEW